MGLPHFCALATCSPGQEGQHKTAAAASYLYALRRVQALPTHFCRTLLAGARSA